MNRIAIYDTTLRDGTQAEDINLTAEDKLKIVRKLDTLGIAYAEAGWPGSNETDRAFFAELRNYSFSHLKISAFGSTHHPGCSADKDANLNAIIESGAPAASIFGKTWDLHATQALRVDLNRNLELIRDSIAYLKANLEEVFFDAEHFFDGYKSNPEYAISVLEKAHEAGADVLVLCDTNGGTLPGEVREIMDTVVKRLPETAAFGIHAHNDCELAVANSLQAVRSGAIQIQGTINGYGERCGNANLCSIIPNLELKLGRSCIPEGKLPMLTLVSSYVAEVANVQQFNRQPFVGRSAFAHKGGVHVSAVNRNAALYEHINPEVLGNRQRILLTELAGRSNIVHMARRFGFHLDKDEPVVKGLLAELKRKASYGYDFAAAEASVELLLFKKLGQRGVREFFRLIKFNVQDFKSDPESEPTSEATVMLEVEGEVAHTAAMGHGPVNALDNALRKALRPFYPNLAEMRLIDFKVRVLSASDRVQVGTASGVRVLIESGDRDSRWVTVGVSYNIIEASWQGLVDSITYKLYKDEQTRRNGMDEE